MASLVCVPANGVYKDVEVLNGAKRHRETNTLALASGREASAASKSNGLRGPSSPPTSGLGVELRKWLLEAFWAENEFRRSTKSATAKSNREIPARDA